MPSFLSFPTGVYPHTLFSNLLQYPTILLLPPSSLLSPIWPLQVPSFSSLSPIPPPCVTVHEALDSCELFTTPPLSLPCRE